MKYKKERINGWTWVLPILLCSSACAVAVAGNFHPKVAVVVEPKGPIGRAIESVLEKVSLYEKEIEVIEKQAEMDCFHFATLQDVLQVNVNERYNLLLKETNKFFNKTREFIQPLKDIIAETRRKAFNDIGEAIFGEETLEEIKNLKNIDLTFLPLVLLIPRAIQLLILIFGMMVMSCASCNMTIYVEPQKIVDAFGNLCKFTMFYCILSQVALFDVLTSFGIPFYRVYIEYGLGFMYDVASEAIMWSIWIGMNNQFFFAIPRRRTTVTYSVPGVSDGGPNAQNKIV